MGLWSRVKSKFTPKPKPQSKSSSGGIQGGGTYNASTGTYIAPSGLGYSTRTPPKSAVVTFSGGGGGSSATPTTTPKTPIQKLTPLTTTVGKVGGQKTIQSQLLSSAGWSGKVEEIGSGGKVVGTKYIAGGKYVGGIEKGYAMIPSGVKHAGFKFGDYEDVKISKEKIEKTFYETAPVSKVESSARPISTVEAVDKKGLLWDIETFKSKQETKGERDLLTPIGRVGLFGAKAITPFVAFPSRVFGFGKGLVTEPIKTITSIPSGVSKSIKQIGVELKSPTPESALGTLFGEYYLFKGLGVAVSKTGGIIELGSARLSPKYTPTGKVTGGTGEGIIGTEKFFERSGASIKKFSGEDVSLFKGEIKGISDIPFAPSPISKVAEPVVSQLGRVGEKIKVVSAQTSFPLGKELDRLLFFDPKGRLRKSRLGMETQKEAGILDILSGDVTFRKGKKQTLIGEFQVDIPPTDIFKKIKRGETLTGFELTRFQEFVETPTGKLKPIPQFKERGYGAVEPEVAFGKGEIPFKVGKKAVTIIDKRKVSVIEIGVKQSSKETQKALSNIQKTFSEKGLGGFETKGLQTSFKTLSKETGFSVRELSSQFKPSKPFVSLPKVFGSSTLSLSKLVSKRGLTSGLSFPFKPSKAFTSISTSKFGFIPSTRILFPPSVSTPYPPLPLITGISVTITDEQFEPFEPFKPPIKPPIRRTAERKKIKKIVKKKKTKGGRVAPSFTSIVADLRGQFPKIHEKWGVLPSQLRLQPVLKKKKKKKNLRLTKL